MSLNKFKNKKDAQQHGEKIVKGLPVGWNYRIVEDTFSKNKAYFVSFENKELFLNVEEDEGGYSLYHSKKDYVISNKSIVEGVQLMKNQILKEAEELLFYANKM